MVPSKKTPASKLSLVEKRAAARAAGHAAEVAQEALDEAGRVQFEIDRPVAWLRIWAKALRLTLLVANESTFRENNSWWFDEFSVDLAKQTISLESQRFYRKATCEADLCESDVTQVNMELDTALGWFEDHLAAREVARLNAIELAHKRDVARAKLTKEDRDVLGLS